MKKFFKQPNEKYCYFSYNGIEDFNLTEQDIRSIFISDAEQEAEDAIKTSANFGGIIEELLDRNDKSSKEWLKQIGFTESFEELVKYVPRRPLHAEYAPCDFTTYAKCPNCNKTVQNCMGHGQKECECGQRLKWD